MQNAPIAPDAGDFDTGPPFVFGFRFRDGVGAPMRWEDAAAGDAYDWLWLHLNMNNDTTRTWIGAQGDIPFAAQSALLAGETRPRVSAFDNGLVVNLRGVNLNEGAEPEDMVSMRIWLDEKRLITTRRRRLKAAQDIRDEIIAGLKIPSPGELLARLAAGLTARTEPYVEEIEDLVDEIEDDILKGAGEGCRSRLADVRQTAVLFRRFIAPQRDVVNRLALEETGLFSQNTRVELREVADRVTRMTEDIDAARERAMVLQDQLADQRAEEMNRNMMILSVVAAIFLPLGFLTGLLGINVGGMPGADSAVAFWVVVALCGVIAAGLVFLFHRKGWL